MKKTILALILAGSSAAVCAQDTTTNVNNMNNMDSARKMSENQKSTGNYEAYGNMPASIQRNFQAQFPGTTGAQWQQTHTGFWRATMRQNEQLTTVNYAQNGESFITALPVLQSSVPQDIVSRALDLYGNNVYDIALVKLPNPQLAALDSAIAAASMNPANATIIGNPPNVTGTDTTAMNNTTGDTTAGITERAPNTFWGVDTTGKAAMPRTIDLYMVRIIDNGMLRAQRMNADGSPDLGFGTTMASPIPSNMNMNNNMNQNLTTTNVNMNTATPTYSDYYKGNAVTNVSTGNYAAKDSAAQQAIDTTANMPVTDTTANKPITDTTSASPMTDTTTRPSTDTTSSSSSVNPTGDMNNTAATQLNNESGNAATSTSTDMNNNTNTTKKNKKNKKNKSTDGTNSATGTNGSSGGY